EGREHLPADGGYLLVSNHQSFLDIPIVAAALPDRHVCFVARESLARSRPLAWLMRRSGAILIRRGASDRRALSEMVEHLRAGDVVCVYPEGTRSADGTVGEFLPGALFASKRARVPIVPTAIWGAHRALPRDAVVPRPARITIRFGEPVDGGAKDAMELARESILGMIQQL
ncbi:MAG TPA: 1-acyl-sn-glycerol-3-phosphate acyltransferase, partial [Planctomycetes bacterium]|nr:1-acyl-sn-glycerol-3-phosphate acyltransferase [Planctomycetota bacterium]